MDEVVFCTDNESGPQVHREGNKIRQIALWVSMFQNAKNAITSKAAQVYLNGLLVRYGEVERVKIDSGARTIAIRVKLKGEVVPIDAEVGEYIIHEVRGKKFIEFSQCRCSRPWLQSLMEDLSASRRVELPPWAAAAL